jgi:hypothetical protein
LGVLPSASGSAPLAHMHSDPQQLPNTPYLHLASPGFYFFPGWHPITTKTKRTQNPRGRQAPQRSAKPGELMAGRHPGRSGDKKGTYCGALVCAASAHCPTQTAAAMCVCVCECVGGGVYSVYCVYSAYAHGAHDVCESVGCARFLRPVPPRYLDHANALLSLSEVRV